MATEKQADRLSGTVALVTGGSAGIGAGCVRCLHADGAQVVFCSNVPDEGAQLVLELGSERAHFVEADCRVEADIARVVAAAIDRFGALDCLINNVGWHPANGTIDDFSAEDFRRLFELNVMSGFLFSQKSLPHLRRSDRAPSIINISSMVAQIGQAKGCTYVATKGAVSALTRALAVDEAVHGVRINSVSPSNIDTPLMSRNHMENMTEEQRTSPANLEAALAGSANQILFKRLGTLQDVGSACAFLASKDASFLTGIDLFVSGGAELGVRRKQKP